jgi:hypothetical protein
MVHYYDTVKNKIITGIDKRWVFLKILEFLKTHKKYKQDIIQIIKEKGR